MEKEKAGNEKTEKLINTMVHRNKNWRKNTPKNYSNHKTKTEKITQYVDECGADIVVVVGGVIACRRMHNVDSKPMRQSQWQSLWWWVTKL